MAAISLYDKNLYKASSPEPGVYHLKIGMQHWVLKFYRSIINCDLWLTVPILRHGHNRTPVNLNGKHCFGVIQLGKLMQHMSKLTKDLYF